ncbi:MAG: YdiU family protein [Pseudomonadota bacterium]
MNTTLGAVAIVRHIRAMTVSLPPDLLTHEYADLPEHFAAKQIPDPSPEPLLFAWNDGLATELGISGLDEGSRVALCAGNAVPSEAMPIAAAYAGHQFGGLVPQLGDGRAVLLGERADKQGRPVDIQLKGSGPTPFSRGGDGRAWLGPVLREYLISEAMHALGVPTTRALGAVTTGAKVWRERALPGAIVTRTARSHVRVGTFIYFAIRGDKAALETLVQFSLQRCYPHLQDTENAALALLEAVVDAQAALVAKWMGLGFIHGVMNTDNVAISGETIDYGPCAFMDEFARGRVFSSIDQQGRYAYANQPRIAHWNLAQFAGTLLPILVDDEAAAQVLAQEAVNAFGEAYDTHWRAVLAAKLGFESLSDENLAHTEVLFDLMEQHGLDFTNTFRALALGSPMPDVLNDWHGAWLEQLSSSNIDAAMAKRTPLKANPAIIPRNHQVEKAITAAAFEGDFKPFESLREALETPFDQNHDNTNLTVPPTEDARVTRTFCGT